MSGILTCDFHTETVKKITVSTSGDMTYTLKNVKSNTIPVTVDITILKVDDANTSTKLGGATLKLTKVQSIDSTSQVTDTPCEQTGTTSSKEADKGTLAFSGLTPGYYYLQETSPPAGYVASDNGWHFQVNDSGIVNGVGDFSQEGRSPPPHRRHWHTPLHDPRAAPDCRSRNAAGDEAEEVRVKFA